MSLFDRRLLSTIVVMLGAVDSRAWGARDSGSGARPRGARPALLVAVAAVAAACSLSGVAAGAALGASCPNAQFRTGAGATLPDCRAYEMVSPPDTNGADVKHPAYAVSTDGNSIAWLSAGAFAGQRASASPVNTYLSARNGSDWSTSGITPPITNPGVTLIQDFYSGWSADLQHMVAEQQGGEPQNAYLRNPDGSLTVIDPGQPISQGISSTELFAGASSDFSKILLNDPAALTTNAANDGNDKLYEWTASGLRLVSVLPDGTPSDGAAIGLNNISADGSRIYWSVGSGQGSSPLFSPIYLSQNDASTEVTTSQCTTGQTGGTGPGGNCLADGSSANGRYFTASSDGSVAFFTSPQELTNDANVSGLYSYDAATGALTDLSPDTNAADTNGPNVQGLLGASADGSYVYYMAAGALAAGASPATCGIARTALCNLYVWHDGRNTFIAALLSRADISDWNTPFHPSSAQVSPDGTTLLFTSTSSLTGYNNAGDAEVFRYDATSGTLSCLSCDPSGAAPAGSASLSATQTGDRAPQSNMSANGQQVFFESPDPLLPGATDGDTNVYEWEADGAGSCESTADNGGCLYLISTGQSSADSFYEGTNASGSDVFIATRDDLVAQDVGDNLAVYDARIDGGLASQSQSGLPAPPCLSSGACGEAGVAPPSPVFSATLGFSGPGNQLPPSVSTTKPTTAKVKIAKRVVKRTALTLSIKVPAKGRLTITGADVKRVSKSVAKPGIYRVGVRLTRAAARTLKKRRRLKVTVKVAYRPASGRSSTATTSIAVKA